MTAQQVLIRSANSQDVPALATLMRSYMRETYNDSWHGSPEAMERDGFGREFEMHVAALGDGLLGLAAWRKAYDLHHCMTGAEVFDMYVVPSVRGRTIGASLVCAVAASVLERGGQFLRGQAVDDPSVRRLYQRVSTSFMAVECTLSGRAFRAVAELAHASPRQLVRSLPPKAWNYEA